VHEPLAGSDLRPNRASRSLAFHQSCQTGLDDGRLALMQNADLPIAFYAQLTLKRGEALDESGVAVFPHDTRADNRGQLGGRAACRVAKGRSRIVARSPVAGFSQTSPTLIG
jgi:hypothetical protein